MPRIEKISPCPYIIARWSKSEKEIAWAIKEFRTYTDYIIFKDGEPDELYRIHKEEE